MMNDKKRFGIYVHIPYCVRKCAYCDFCSRTPASGETESYVSALNREIAMYSRVASGYTADTVFFGGGTPTLLSPDTLCGILDSLRAHYDISDNAEITSEANPGTVSAKALETLHAGGFNRISFGLQAADDRILAKLSRIHRLSDFEKSYGAAREAGFDNINVDLMYGLPGQTLSDFESTLLYTGEKIKPEHISVYGLILEPGTPFYEKKDSLCLPDEDSELEMNRSAERLLAQRGYHRYEISNYAMDGFECRHNLRYWESGEYMGFGAAASSFFGGERYTNTDNIDRYIGKAGTESVVAESEKLTEKTLEAEFVMLEMRLSRGVSAARYTQLFGGDFFAKYLPRLSPYIGKGLVIADDIGCRFTSDGMYISNTVLADILDF